MNTPLLSSLVLLLCSGLLTGAEERPASEEAARSFEIDSKLATRAHWSIQEGRGVLQISLPAVRDGLPLPKPPATRIWLLQPGGDSTKPSTSSEQAIGTSMAGSTTPHTIHEFPMQDARTAVAAVVQLESEFFVFPLNQESQPPRDGR